MGDSDIEDRVTAAAQRVREHDLTAQRCASLAARRDAMAADLEAAKSVLSKQERDMQRLEHPSLTRVLASLRGSRDDALARERAEAEAARYRVADAESRLRAVLQDYDATQAQLTALANAPARYAALLDEKEHYLRASGDARGRRLLGLAEESGPLQAELREIDEAVSAAKRAEHALAALQDSLGRAEGWSTYDTFFGGGAISSAIKHSRLDEAAQQAEYADRCLLALRTELADVGESGPVAPQLPIDGLTRFVDVWFDNIFTDFSVRGRIKDAQANVDRALRAVFGVSARLRRRGADIQTRLGQIDTERLAVLAA
jgi:hypothetical protein